VDNELSDDQELAVTGHIKSCPDCTCLADDYRHIGQHVARGYRHATAGLSERIRASIKREKLVGLTLGCVGAMRRAAVLLFAMGLSAPATALALRSSQEQASLEREILTSTFVHSFRIAQFNLHHPTTRRSILSPKVATS
jgi:hypothetical protein